jgi:ABC-2 type transport system permease protein
MRGLGDETVRNLYLIARREFLTRVRTRFFLIGTLVLMVLLGGYIVLQARVLNNVTTTVKVAFVGSTQVLAPALKASAGAEGVKVETSVLPDVGTGEDQVRNGRIDVLVSGDPTGPQVAVKDKLDPIVAGTLTGLVRQEALHQALSAAGVDPATVEAKVAAAGLQVSYLDPNAAQSGQRDVVAVFVAALLYVSMAVYGQLVASGVVEEKANRIIEILLATVRPRQLLFGKVVGIGLVGLVQLAVLGVVAIIAIDRTQAISVPSLGAWAVADGLFWFVLGFLFYALIYAAGGSLVSRQEDIGSVTGPISMILVGTYLAFFWVVSNPNNPIGIALSLVPPFAPVLMPARIATGDASSWQIVVAIALTLAGIALMNFVAARIYINLVHRIGSRVKFVEAWRGRL